MTRSYHELIEQLRRPDANERLSAATALGEARETRALPALLQAMRGEPDLYVRETITWALVRLGELAIQPLVDALRHEHAQVRQDAAHALGKIGDSRALNALISILADNEVRVVIKSVQALGQIGAGAATPALMPLLGHSHAELRATLSTALGQLRHAALPLLIRAINDERLAVREHALEALGLIGGADAEAALITATRDAQAAVRLAAAMALSECATPAARAALQAVLTDSDARVRAAAASAS
jgi:HEAT repeat protein